MTPLVPALAHLTTGVPVDVDRDSARDAAREELSRRLYREAEPGLFERVVRWLFEQAMKLLGDFAGVSPGGYAGLVVVLLVVVAAAVAVRLKVGPMSRTASRGETLFTGRPRSAAEHRAAADVHAAAGEWAEAVRERLRAVVRGLEERSLLEPRPGRTADEAAAEGGAVLPDCARDLRQGAAIFDDVWYGGRAATAASHETLRRLDDRVRASRPVLTGGPR